MADESKLHAALARIDYLQALVKQVSQENVALLDIIAAPVITHHDRAKLRSAIEVMDAAAAKTNRALPELYGPGTHYAEVRDEILGPLFELELDRDRDSKNS